MRVKKFLAGLLACIVMGGALPTISRPAESYGANIEINDVGEIEYTTFGNTIYIQSFYSIYDHVNGCKDYYGTKTLDLSDQWDKRDYNVVIKADAFSGIKAVGSIILPDSVTKIEKQAFCDMEYLKTIELPDKLESIGSSAFHGCKRLSSVAIPDRVTKIEEMTFSGCESLTNITIPERVESIGLNAFYACGLTEIDIPENVKFVDGYAFAHCKDLETVTYEDDLEIGANPFYDTKWLENRRAENPLVVMNNVLIDAQTYSDDVVVIPDGIKRIDYRAFEGCKGLNKVHIPDSVTEIGGNAFYECTGLTEVNLPDSITSIGYYAFYYCEHLKSISLPKNLKELYGSVFAECERLVDVKLPENLEYIGWGTFENCIDLKEIILPKSVCYIGPDSFKNCRSLEKIVIKNKDAVFSEEENLIATTKDNKFNGTIYGYEGSTAQKYAEKRKLKFEVIEEEIDYGDATCDGKVDICDAVLIMQSIIAPDKYDVGGTDENAMTEQGKINADCYKPGSGVTPMDALSVQKLLLGSIEALPEI